MDRPWWVLAFLLPLCCGSTVLLVVFGIGTGGILGGLFLGGAAGPWGALAFGAMTGISAAVPFLVVASRLDRQRAACHVPATSAPGQR